MKRAAPIYPVVSAVYCGNYDITVKAGNQAVSLNTDILRKFGVHEGAQKLVIEL